MYDQVIPISLVKVYLHYKQINVTHASHLNHDIA